MIDEEKKEIWNYISKGYTFSTEYMGGDLPIMWIAFYKGNKISMGFTTEVYNYDDIISTWRQHRRDNILLSILEEVDKKGIKRL